VGFGYQKPLIEISFNLLEFFFGKILKQGGPYKKIQKQPLQKISGYVPVALKCHTLSDPTLNTKRHK